MVGVETHVDGRTGTYALPASNRWLSASIPVWLGI